MPPPPRHSFRIALHALARPLFLLAGLGLALAPVAWGRLAAIGLATDPSLRSVLIYELAFLGALAGVLAGLQALDEWTWLLRRWQPAETLRLEAGVVAMAGGILAGTPILASLPAGADLSPASLATLGLGLFQIVAAAILLRRVSLPPGARSMALLAVCWWIPAAIAPSFPFGLGLAPRALASAGGAGPALHSPHTWAAGTLLGIALVLAARLGPGRAARRP